MGRIFPHNLSWILVAVFWTIVSGRYQYELTNVLRSVREVTCTASSTYQSLPFFDCSAAYDGDLYYGRDWIADGAGDAWINFTFPYLVTIHEIKLWPRCQYESRYKQYLLRFTNGPYEEISSFCYDNSRCGSQWPLIIHRKVVTSYVRITGQLDCVYHEGNNGLREVEVWGEMHDLLTLPTVTCAASSEYNQTHSCARAFDGVTLPDSYSEWITSLWDQEPWLEVEFLGPVVVSGVYMWTACSPVSKVNSLTFVFGDDSQQSVTWPCNSLVCDWPWKPVHHTLRHVLTRSIRIILSGFCQDQGVRDSNTGIREIQIYGRKVTAELLTRTTRVNCTASSTAYSYSPCSGVFDGDVSVHREWLAADTDMQPWIRLQFGELVVIYNVSVKQIGLFPAKSASFKFVFDDQSSLLLEHGCVELCDEGGCNRTVSMATRSPVLTSTVTVVLLEPCVSGYVRRGVTELEMYGRRLVPFVEEEDDK